MRRVLLIGLFLALSSPALATVDTDGRYDWPVIGVVDGDTLKVHLPGLPMELQPLKVRVRGVDTPERKGKCAAEKAAAEKAGTFTRQLVEKAQAKQRPIIFSKIDWDKYGGRIDADVAIDGRSLADMLVGAGLARRYDGGKRKGWC
ncbi:thermonuclease family protein [Dongia sp.]|uniref:thermonuclease family protein n=1 Tax=Dongia sp. TaxID=1977262 RepID=UPI0035B2C12A